MKKQSGITLIALVVTIVVLLILSLVTIAMLTGTNGIINKAAQSRTETSQAEAKEKVQLEIVASYNNDGSLNLEKLKTNLTDDLSIAEVSGDTTSGPLTFDFDGYNFSITKNSEITVTDAAE